ncbi:DUF5990 family protein [Actinoplanes regularis]|uniref:Monooxygenase n=1 Tax=Actinoplanes regularis TaxID=52697 RepID=A0A239AFG3_9ACTN|nr:DUF5990 family protein [Actinoplanes regularis]GIE86902.1 hypothetical protein Are01nite_33820 [Actinoplanes regularis]GLW28474.1 hypothetical protein Areg01_14140 [Actinoplanes regularis]SNR93653.1 hypothetical protein SAMN06264365_107263 [Actinoplanes regularis]
MRIRIEGRDLPQSPELRLNDVHVGVQRRAEVIGRVPVTADHATWELDVAGREVDGLLDVGGPWVHGPPGARFLYLSWGAVRDDEFTMFRRAKLLFGDVPGELLRAAFEERGVLVGRLGLTDERGEPRCARVRPPLITWTLE